MSQYIATWIATPIATPIIIYSPCLCRAPLARQGAPMCFLGHARARLGAPRVHLGAPRAHLGAPGRASARQGGPCARLGSPSPTPWSRLPPWSSTFHMLSRAADAGCPPPMRPTCWAVLYYYYPRSRHAPAVGCARRIVEGPPLHAAGPIEHIILYCIGPGLLHAPRLRRCREPAWRSLRGGGG